MGFFDNLKSSLTETGQDLSQKANRDFPPDKFK